MFFRSLVPALAGLSLAAAVPTSLERDAAGVLNRRGLPEKRDVIIEQTVVEPQVVVINNNLGALNALALQAEQEFAALVQSQLVLINTVETIKNNIRVNHFKTRWNTVNTVLVTVTNVVDARDPKNVNNRYMVNQLKADNNNPASEILVMMTAAEAITIAPVATPTNLNVPGVTGAGSLLSKPTAQPQVAQADPTQAFAQAANGGSVLLPFNSTAPKPPSGAQLFPDPAAIILPNQALFVGDVALIQQDAALLAQGSLFNLQSQLLAQEAIANAELAGVVLGNAQPPTVIINNNPPAAAPPAAQPPAAQPPAAQPPAAQPPAAQSPASQPPAAQSPASQPPAAQSPAAQSPAAQPPAAQSPASQPPAAQSPAAQPPAGQ